MTASSSENTIQTNNIQYIPSNSKYQACYWHFRVSDYTWKDGAKIVFEPVTIHNLTAYLYSGTARDNFTNNIMPVNQTLS